MTDIKFVSDTHFYHGNIIKHCNRPWPYSKDAPEMTAALIAKWNAKVKPGDTVYHLGDVFRWFAIDQSMVNNVLDQLNGYINLVEGNHDLPILDLIRKHPKVNVLGSRYVLNIAGKDIVLDHYPVESWYGMSKGSYHFHGHVHNSPTRHIVNRVNLSVEMTNYEPVSLDEILAMFPDHFNDVKHNLADPSSSTGNL